MTYISKKKIKNDVILVAALLVIAAAGFMLYSIFKQAGDYAVVSIDGSETARFPLGENVTYEIVTENGVNVLVIADGKASVTQASCPDLICVGHRAIDSVGETIVCLPNKVVISIEKSSDSGLDIAI